MWGSGGAHCGAWWKGHEDRAKSSRLVAENMVGQWQSVFCLLERGRECGRVAQSATAHLRAEAESVLVSSMAVAKSIVRQ